MASQSEQSHPPAILRRLLGLSLMVRLCLDVVDGTWHVHGGELFPYGFPTGRSVFYGQWGLELEWALAIVAGVGLFFSKRGFRGFCWLGFLTTLAGLSQRFQNQRVFLAWTLLFCALPIDWSRTRRLLITLLVCVYVASLGHKILEGFWDGDALRNALIEAQMAGNTGWIHSGWVPSLNDPIVCAFLAKIALFAETIAVVSLLAVPALGFAWIVGMHLGISLLIPGTWAFTLAIVAAATATLSRAESSNF